MSIRCISAITFAVREMSRAVSFYEKCGMSVTYGGPAAEFTSLRCGESFVNLIHSPGHQPAWWGRVILRVQNADRAYEAFRAAGLSPDPPRDAPWGERFFHICDPDGHELSFAELLKG
jgi:catechol 2,3-dioxygenase-like lactoylglutathione lyase family enzyme